MDFKNLQNFHKHWPPYFLPLVKTINICYVHICPSWLRNPIENCNEPQTLFKLESLNIEWFP